MGRCSCPPLSVNVIKVKNRKYMIGGTQLKGSVNEILNCPHYALELTPCYHLVNFTRLGTICLHLKCQLCSLHTEIFIFFLARRNLFKYKCVINIYIILNNRIFIAVKLMSFNFNIIKLYNSFVHILYMIINFCVSLCSTFFSLKSTLF